MPEKILLIGRGIAGSILSFQLHARQMEHEIIDLPTLSQSSKVAAGLINPVVLKRLKLVQNADAFLSEALEFYRTWESRLETSFYHQIPIKHILQDPGEANLWMEKSEHPQYDAFLGEISSEKHTHLLTKAGLGIMKKTGWLNTTAFLDNHLTYHKDRGVYHQQEISAKDIEGLSRDYDQVIICTGHLMQHLIPETKKVFTPTRGELIIIETFDLPEDAIYHGPVFILPLGKHQFKVGATYHWDIMEDVPTEAGLNKLQNDLARIFNGSYKLLEHQAGVRPNVKDRKPLLGKIFANLFCFNGMGSRGILMAPYLSKVFVDFLKDGQALPESYDIARYLKP